MSFGGSRLALKDGMLKEVCRLQSLLLQFIHPRVREDFVSGLLGVEGSEALLDDLDFIRRIVIPPWRGRSILTMAVQLDGTTCHLTNLMKYSSNIFDIRSSKKSAWTYSDWAKYLSELATSTYWGITDPDSICVDYITVPTNTADLQPIKIQASSKTNKDPEESMSDPLSTQQQLLKTSDFKHSHHNDATLLRKPIHKTSSPKDVPRTRLSKIETISLSDSLTDSSETTSESSSSGSSSSSRRRRRRRRGKYSQREVVQPLAFDMNGHLSLKSFFNNYERYFSARFEGSSRDCTQELRHFLPSEMEQYYDALGGRRLKYRHMKEELLKWYKARKRGGTRYWKEQLMEAAMRTGEELRLYGMRLLEMGQKAYPQSDRECLKEVKYHFLNTVPPAFASYVRQSEQMIRVVDRERRLKWADIMKLAEDEDEQKEKTASKRQETREPPRVWFSREETENSQNQHYEAKAGKETTQRRQRGSSYSSRTFSSRNSPPPAVRAAPSKPESCQWCGRAGHSVNSCWRRRGACVLCGNLTHSKEQCPKFRPRKTTNSPATICPRCQGEHLGMNCNTASN